MNATSNTYQQQLLMALRLRNIPGPRIAEALAEVDSHVAETGEDLYQAFGTPKAYAERLSEALGVGDELSLRTVLRTMTWRDAVPALGIVVGAGLLFSGLTGLGEGFLSLPALAVLVGLISLAWSVRWVARDPRRKADDVLDPRTGRNMAPPFPRWSLQLWGFFPAAVLLLGYYLDGR